MSVESLSGNRLPYIDNLVNIVVSEDLGKIKMDEVMRVLAPDGVAYVKKGAADKWAKTIKPRPKEMDDWTHYLHDPQGTMVGRDTIVGPPRRMQWVGGPKWLRNHDFMSSLNGMVSANGRVFYLIDEGLRKHIYLPARWAVIARDAFNGTTLWKRKIDQWFPHTIPFKSGPGVLPRRIVAVGDRLYVTLGIDAPLSVLDAATGRTIRTYEQTRGTAEIVLDGGVLYLVVDSDKGPVAYKHASPNRGKERDRVNQEFGWSKDSPPSLVMALAAETGRVLWKHQGRVAPTTLALAAEKVVYFDGERVVALNRNDGEEKWVSESAGNWAVPATGYTARLMAGDDVIVLSTRRGISGGRLAGISTANGKILWRSEQLKSGHFTPEDLYLINGLVWTAQTGKSQETGTKFQAVDAKTGRTEHEFAAEQIEAFFMHQRCYPGRATERYIMASGTGTEFLKLGTEQCEIHHWLRGSCIYGIMPCNGLLYKTPDSCACFYQSKLPHLCAIAPEGKRSLPAGPKDSRLEKGPAFAAMQRRARSRPQAWPAYRRDNTRSGATRTTVTARPTELWKTNIGGKLSAITAADGKLFVAAIDRHTVYALAADTGKEMWSFTAGGRVDSPPTIYNRTAIFGSADGWVYSLRASDGELAWRFRAAPGPDKLISYEQPESVWPVHGSVLVREGVIYALAGRTSFLDGGMHLVRLDSATGKLLSETVMDDKDPATGKNAQTLIAGKAMPVANPDLFSSDQNNIYMGSQKFDFQGNRVDIAPAKGKERIQTGPGRHLFCPTGFLDDYWFHRSYWIYGINAGEGHGEYTVPRSFAPVGRIMAFDDSRIYTFYAHNVGNNINPRTHYSLYAVDKNPPAPGPTPQPAPAAKKKRTNPKRRQPRAQAPKSRQRNIWEIDDVGVLANAMVLAGDKLFVAGAPDVADETKTFEYVYGADDQLHRQLRKQEQAWLGKQGALLWVVSADSGEKLGEYKIPAIPVWDGMIAANGRLYISSLDGCLMCMGEKK